MSDGPKVKRVCATCETTEVVVDAYVSWNTATQQWEVDNVFEENGYCDRCEGATKIYTVRMEEN